MPVPPPIVDTHCHINFELYAEDRDAVIERAEAAGVSRIIIPAVELETNREGIALAAKYPGIYAAVGVHPNSTTDFNAEMLAEIESLSHEPKVVAVGEIGLDYYWDRSPKSAQIKAFESQLELAARLELPVIIHNRGASDDVIAILETWTAGLPESLKNRPGVLHSFSAPQEIAERALACGFYLGFTGPITFKKADDLRQVASGVPLERILAETDGPFLTPHPYRGKRNEPAYVTYIVEKLAELKDIGVEAMAQTTTQNAERLFKL